MSSRNPKNTTPQRLAGDHTQVIRRLIGRRPRRRSSPPVEGVEAVGCAADCAARPSGAIAMELPQRLRSLEVAAEAVQDPGSLPAFRVQQGGLGIGEVVQLDRAPTFLCDPQRLGVPRSASARSLAQRDFDARGRDSWYEAVDGQAACDRQHHHARQSPGAAGQERPHHAGGHIGGSQHARGDGFHGHAGGGGRRHACRRHDAGAGRGLQSGRVGGLVRQRRRARGRWTQSGIDAQLGILLHELFGEVRCKRGSNRSHQLQAGEDQVPFAAHLGDHN
mmetsp:Transcript_94661/g.272553  ORF Transcript_94661/g.272553 Transcript_94661/m.272553 type:complete len:277 (+) Transcript_94661:119-949(+)